MKRWYVKLVYNCEEYIYSLLSMDAHTKTCVVRSDSGSRATIYFNIYHKYDFAVAKSGIEVLAEVRFFRNPKKYKCKVIFK